VVVAGVEHAVCAGAGGKHSVVVTADGRVVSFGRGESGQLGRAGGGGVMMAGPQTMEWIGADQEIAVASVACGDRHTLLVARDGALYAFGSNVCGQLGLGDTADRAVPTRVVDMRGSVVQAAGGGGFGEAHTVVLTSLGEVFSWGSSGHGQLGHGSDGSSGTRLMVTTPRQVVALRGKRVMAVACGWLCSACIVDETPLAPQSLAAAACGTLGLFTGLSEDVVKPMLGLLDGKSLARLAQTCKMMNFWIADDEVWHSVFLNELDGKRAVRPDKVTGVTWRRRVSQLCRQQRSEFGGGGIGVGALSRAELDAILRGDGGGGVGGWLRSVLRPESNRFPIRANGLTGTKSIVMLGLDAAGKTTILYKLRFADLDTTIPTIGFNMETARTADGVNVTCWDVGGEDRIWPLWRHYLAGLTGIVWVVDSNDRERINDVQHELWSLYVRRFSEMTAGIPLLVLANKQDLPRALGVADIADHLQLDELAWNCGCSWWVQACCAISGEGLCEGLAWLQKETSR
jgi:small GTP-binding protein